MKFQKTSGTAPILIHEEPDLSIKVIREHGTNFKKLLIQGDKYFDEIKDYIDETSPELNEIVELMTSLICLKDII